jgi:small-conductance mechanosensitive channel
LSQLTIVVGALSVGIGFGMQNIVNNFISGLILLFERPINLGDRIEIGQVSGVIKDIGIRASVVRTWDGADVVVPNATLLSDNLVNWTLHDLSRRMNIQVGVAYGTDPERMIFRLVEIAQAHDEVLEDPAPTALFVGFGDSALVFELRAWTNGDFVTIASELRVQISRMVRDEGIEIPFPQRDLHLRSVPAGLGLAATGTAAGEDPAVESSDESTSVAGGPATEEDPSRS